MSVTLTITDNANGTGATATIAGSLGGTNNVYVARINGATGSPTFALSGTRVGDGTVLLPITTPGLYWGYCLTAGALSNLYYFPVTLGTDAVASRIRDSVISTIQLLTIPPAANVYSQMFVDDTNVQFPCVICTVDGTNETENLMLNTHDDIGRPCKVMIADRVDKLDHVQLRLYESWRQSIERCFRNQQLAGVPEVVQCRIEPYVIIDPNAREYQHLVSAFALRFQSREPRGVGY